MLLMRLLVSACAEAASRREEAPTGERRILLLILPIL